MTTVIRFDHVSKRFTLHHQRARSFQDLFVNLFRRNGSREEFWALRDVSFEIKAGESVGIIGENGSGKSTTLKLMTRILKPTIGTVQITGSVSALLELGAGFHPDLTGKENIYLNGSLLGFSKRKMDESYRSIVEFAELEKFIDTPIKHYSSGMVMRLGFAIAVTADPDILITDEVLAVGDESFQRKCLDKIWQFKRRGKTIVFVSHSLQTVVDLCSRAIWLEDGRVMADGRSSKVVEEYRKRVYAKYQAQLEHQQQVYAPIVGDGNRWGSGEAVIEDVIFLDAHGHERHVYETGEPMIVRIKYRAHKRIEQPVFGVAIYRSDGTHVNGPNTRLSNYPIEALEGEGEIDYIIDSLPLLAGSYEFTAAIYNYDSTHPYDHHHRMYTFKVRPGEIQEREGTIYIPCRWDLRPKTSTGVTDDAHRLLQPA